MACLELVAEGKEGGNEDGGWDPFFLFVGTIKKRKCPKQTQC